MEGEGGVGVTSARGYGGIQGCHLLCLVLGSGGEGVLQAGSAAGVCTAPACMTPAWLSIFSSHVITSPLMHSLGLHFYGLFWQKLWQIQSRSQKEELSPGSAGPQ